MPVIVVLSDCPPKLRGDMTKWFFEVNTGVYVGNISTRVRENLWQRITENIGRGHATMVYSAPGEQHMDFRVHNAYWEPADFDGIKLMRRPEQKHPAAEPTQKETGFSNAAKRRMASSHRKKADEFSAFHALSYVVLDLETTGLDVQKDEIVEIGAILVDREEVLEKLQILVRCQNKLSAEITKLTGISDEALKQDGVPPENAVRQLLELAEDLPFVCHNAAFEQGFLQAACSRIDEEIENRFIDTLNLSQRLLPDMKDHKLTTLTEYFDLPYPIRHRALPDCEATYGIYTKLIELASLQTRKNEQ